MPYQNQNPAHAKEKALTNLADKIHAFFRQAEMLRAEDMEEADIREIEEGK